MRWYVRAWLWIVSQLTYVARGNIMIGSDKVCTNDQGIVSLDSSTALEAADPKILYLELLVPVLAMARGKRGPEGW
jgi:hypothetical protein